MDIDTGHGSGDEGIVDMEEAFEDARIVRIDRRSASRQKPARKTSYESNADVQRWLREQAVEEGSVKPKFNPTFLASLRDAPWILSSLTEFYEQDLITDVLHDVKSGKEASVYCCAADPATGADYLAAKVYRPRMFRSLKNDALYRRSRVMYDVDGKIVRGRRQRGPYKESEKGRAARVTSWIEYEYKALQRLYAAGCDVPRPVRQIGNAILMEYIGDLDEPAPLLREVGLKGEEARTLFEGIMNNIELFLAQNLIHGDLSEYNILYWQGAVTIIDLAQAVDPHYDPAVFSLLARDIERVCRYFARYGVEADAGALTEELWGRYVK